ncbi:MAG: hypothetical protein NZ959_02795 [Armatimonadetes bacterium]|nr:hypothetical protein [Armatimonadota bacterium]MDW8121493.1 hypothetical protein [Armatimonadota bacterium]
MGAYFADGSYLFVPYPTGPRWVPQEQVEREIVFRRWQVPLTTRQMADMATALEADFACDLLMVHQKSKRGQTVRTFLRVVSASFSAIVILTEGVLHIRGDRDFRQEASDAVLRFLEKVPTDIPSATVRLLEGQRVVHLTASTGEWRKGTRLLFYREDGRKIVQVAFGRVTRSRKTIGSLITFEARLDAPSSLVRPGDKAVAFFSLPPLLSAWDGS